MRKNDRFVKKFNQQVPFRTARRPYLEFSLITSRWAPKQPTTAPLLDASIHLSPTYYIFEYVHKVYKA